MTRGHSVLETPQECTPLEYDTDYVQQAIHETPGLLDYILSVAKKGEAKRIANKYVKNYLIPVGTYKDKYIQDVNIDVLKRMLNVNAFREEYPLVYYSVKHYVKYGSFS